MNRRASKQHTLSIVVEGNAPPTEFRIFTAGVVDTVKGQFVFDKKAAKQVLAEYKRHGIDLMIDYTHASLSAKDAVDPAESGKAAGWFNLELRNGELWAVNVRWTPPAAEALRNKEWRFMSPAFQTDEDGRIAALMNVAITNLPATRRLEPLVAASRRTKMNDHEQADEPFFPLSVYEKADAELAASGGNRKMRPDHVAKSVDAIANGDGKGALKLLKSIIAYHAGEVVDPEVVDSSYADDASGDEDGGTEDDGAPGIAPVRSKKVRASIARERGVSEREVAASIARGRGAFTTLGRMATNTAKHGAAAFRR